MLLILVTARTVFKTYFLDLCQLNALFTINILPFKYGSMYWEKERVNQQGKILVD